MPLFACSFFILLGKTNERRRQTPGARRLHEYTRTTFIELLLLFRSPTNANYEYGRNKTKKKNFLNRVGSKRLSSDFKYLHAIRIRTSPRRPPRRKKSSTRTRVFNARRISIDGTITASATKFLPSRHQYTGLAE